MKKLLPPSILLFVSAALFLISACSDVLSDQNKEDQIKFAPIESYTTDLEPNAPKLTIQMSTVEYFNTGGFTIDLSTEMVDFDLIVNIKGIRSPNGGVTQASAPAVGIVALPENTRQIIFKRGDESSRYSVNITKDKITLKKQKGKFMVLVYPKTYRYPQNSFALKCSTDIWCSRFLTVLDADANLSQFEFGKDGRIPYDSFDITSNSQEEPIENDSDYHTFFFKYQNNSDFEGLEETYHRFFNNNNLVNTEDTYILITGWNNRKYFHYGN